MLTGGLDEVGWGAGAGPIVSVVVLTRPQDLTFLPKGVTDSKKLSEKRREMFFNQLLESVTDIGIGSCDAWEIDAMSPGRALQETYRRALLELRYVPNVLIVDGSHKVDAFVGQQIVEPKADYNHKQVSAASIIAKVIRDRVMSERAKLFRDRGLSDYGWGENKGYLTSDHIDHIKKHGLLYGPDPFFYQHRRSYTKNLLGKAPIYGHTI